MLGSFSSILYIIKRRMSVLKLQKEQRRAGSARRVTELLSKLW